MIFNVALLGAGVGIQHADNVVAQPESFRLSHVCDLDPERAAKAARNALDCLITSDMDAVLNDPSVDIIDICLPPHLHYDVTMRALHAGKHVIAEKPFVGSLAEARNVRAACQETGKQVIPVFQYRYGPGYRELQALIKSGLAGKCYAIAMETHWQRGAAYYAVPWRGTWAGEMGGTILSHAIHIHNLAEHVAGPANQVNAFVDTLVQPVETEDTAAITWRSSTGALVTSSITVGAAGNSSRMRICFEGLTAQSGTEPYKIAEGAWTFTATDPDRQAEVDAVVAAAPTGPIRFAGFFADVAARLNGRPDEFLPDLDEATQSIALVTAIYASNRSGQRIDLPLSEDHPMYGGWRP